MKSLKAKFRKSDTNEWNKNDDRLLQAVDHGEVDKVTALLGKKGVTATKLDTEGKTAFHVAAMKGFEDCLKVMLNHGVDVSSLDVKGHTALHVAVLNNHIDCVKKLLQFKCPVDCIDVAGKTSLHYAAANGSLPAVQLLSEHKSPLNVKDMEGNTPLLISILHGHTDVLKCLLDHKADINLKDKNGRTPLMLACESGNLPIAEILVHMGANMKLTDAMGHDALHFSRLSGNSQVVTLLLSKLNQESIIKTPTKPVQHDQVTKLSSERSGTPKKRQAPPPPTISPLQQSDLSPSLSSTSTPLSAAGQVFFPEQTSKNENASPQRDFKDRLSDSTGEDSLLDVSSEAEHQDNVSALQAKVAYLTSLNKELQDKLQEKVSGGAVVDISCDSYHSTQTELNESHDEIQDEMSPVVASDISDVSFESQPEIASRELKVKQLEKVVEDMQIKLNESEEERKKMEEQINSVSSGFRHSSSSEVLEEALVTEEQSQRTENEQVGVMEDDASVGQVESEGKIVNEAADDKEMSVVEKFEALQKEYKVLLAESQSKEEVMKDLQCQLDAMTQSMVDMLSAEGKKEMEKSYGAIIEKINQEKDELSGMYQDKLEEIKKLQKELESQNSGNEEEKQVKEDLARTVEDLNKQVSELSLLYNEAQIEIGKTRQSPHKNSIDVINKDEHVKAVQEIKECKDKVEKDLADLVLEHTRTLEELDELKLEKEKEKENTPVVLEHVKVIEALKNTINDLEVEKSDLKDQLAVQETRLKSLQEDLLKQTSSLQESLATQKIFEGQQVSLEEEISSLSLELGDLMKEKEKLSTDNGQVKRELTQLKGEKEALQSQLKLKEQDFNKLRVKYNKVQEDLNEMKIYSENTSKLEEDKDKKINDLSKEVSKLKEALNSLSQLSFSTSTPKRQSQQLETLQHQVKQLQNQLMETKKQHQEIVSVYRTHLLYAVQGQMDEDVQRVLKQILTMCKSQSQKI
ncbi:ankycorbin isoform X1 [Pelobates cultripes]|uniref:Ankycorbin isoform X1 n=1 Tax=Pelobates cultripes TaxID=61616 RepID=A0AAD1W732_PELCU|nr:ankycorbin isoform X1 [Pelobates cultripes]